MAGIKKSISTPIIDPVEMCESHNALQRPCHIAFQILISFRINDPAVGPMHSNPLTQPSAHMNKRNGQL